MSRWKVKRIWWSLKKGSRILKNYYLYLFIYNYESLKIDHPSGCVNCTQMLKSKADIKYQNSQNKFSMTSEYYKGLTIYNKRINRNFKYGSTVFDISKLVWVKTITIRSREEVTYVWKPAICPKKWILQ